MLTVTWKNLNESNASASSTNELGARYKFGKIERSTLKKNGEAKYKFVHKQVGESIKTYYVWFLIEREKYINFEKI